jgi:hypothetical protein
MNIKKFGLSVTAFALATAGAFATNLLSGGPGYTNDEQVPDQGSPCVYRDYCGGGYNMCRITLSGGKTVQLLQLDSDGTCSSTTLSQP